MSEDSIKQDQPAKDNSAGQSQTSEQPQLDNQQQISQQSGPRILIVEDEKDYGDVLEERLQAEGFTVFKVENGQLALNFMKNTDVDLILLDMLMPQMDGATFFYHLKNTLKKDIPVIILTNFTEMAYPEKAADFVVKANTSLDEVVDKIKKNLPVKQ
ncbi:MAG: response regulator [bacterium]|nr:response regulator [bacterium]